MLGKIGLVILSIIQIATSLTIFFSSKQDEMFGMKMLTK